MKRTYFVLPNLLNTKKAYDTLLTKGVGENKIHVLTKDEKALSFFENHKLSLMTYSDFIPSLLKGISLGAALGVLFYVLLVYGFHEQALTPLETSLWVLFFSAMGGWCSTLVGVSFVKPQLKSMLNKVEYGKGLLVVDELEEPVKSYVLNHYEVEGCATL